MSRLAAVVHLLVALAAWAWAQDTVWTRTFDTGRLDGLTQGTVDPFGDLVLCGTVYDDSTGGHLAIVVVKYASSGDTIWSRVYDTPANDHAGGLAVDSVGDIVVVGTFYSGDTMGALAIKYDRNGNPIWERQYLLSEYAANLVGAVTDDSLNIYACGYTFVGGDNDALLVKLERGGDTLWTRAYDLGATGSRYSTGWRSTGMGASYALGRPEKGRT